MIAVAMVDVPMDATIAEIVAKTCMKCWREAHAPPPASALYLMDDYKWDAGYAWRLQCEAMEHARRAGYGAVGNLHYAAHREMYALTGNRSELLKMLRHVIIDETGEADAAP